MKKYSMLLGIFCVTFTAIVLSDTSADVQGKDKLEERIRKYRLEAIELTNFSLSKGPNISHEVLNPNPKSKLFVEIKKQLPDEGIKPVINYVRSVQVLSTSGISNTPIDTIRVESEFYYENPRIPLLRVNPYNGSVSTLNAFSKTTFSNLPLGEECWSAPTETYKKRARNAKLHIANEGVLIRLTLEKQPNNPSSRDPGWRNVTKDDLYEFEFVARLALSKAYMAIHDFDNLKKESATINKAKVTTKRISDKVSLVPIKSLAKQLNWKHEENYGVLTLNTGKNKVVIPAGSRELLMGSRKEKLPLPVILDGKEYWVEKNALLRLLQ